MYETYGKLNAGRNNAILICTRCLGITIVAGYYATIQRMSAGGTT